MAYKQCHFKIIQSLGRLLGQFMWCFLPSRRKIVLNSLKQHMNYPLNSARKIGRNSFLNSGSSFVELLLTRRVDYRFLQNQVNFNDLELFKRIVGSDRPIAAITGHLGAWELLSGLLSSAFMYKNTIIVVRYPKNKALKGILHYFRSHHNVQVVHKDQAAPEVLKCLKKRGVASFLVDHNTGRSKSIFAPFLGKAAAINIGPALLALRAKALVCPMFLLRNGLGHFYLHVEKPLDTKYLSGSLDIKIKTIVSYYTLSIENMINDYPGQWFWMHKRWKTRPKGEAILDLNYYKQYFTLYK